MQNALIPVLGFAAFSGTGKTTLVKNFLKEKNIPYNESQRLRFLTSDFELKDKNSNLKKHSYSVIRSVKTKI